MKIFCNGTDFADAVSKVIKAVSINKTEPILEGIKISAQGDELTFTATDKNFTIIKTIKADVKMEGDILVPGKMIADIARTMSNENEIELSDLVNNNLTIKYNDSSLFLKLMDVALYPTIKESNFDSTVVMTQEELKSLISKTIFCVSTNENGKLFTKGALFNVENNQIEVQTLDGFRFAVCKKTLNSLNDDIKILINGRHLMEIVKLMENDQDIVKLYSNNNKVMFELKDTKVICNLICENFKSVNNLKLGTEENMIIVNKNQFEECVDTCSVMIKYNNINLLKMEISEDKMVLSTNGEMSESKQTIPVKNNGKDLVLKLNVKYLSDCLKNIDDEFIKLITVGNSVLIQPMEGDNFKYLIVQIKN